jgi:hypothetical protein
MDPNGARARKSWVLLLAGPAGALVLVAAARVLNTTRDHVLV